MITLLEHLLRFRWLVPPWPLAGPGSSLALFAAYLVLVGFDLLPPRILDPLWMISFAGTLCNSMTIPLAGLVFLHGAAALAPLSNPIQSR